MNDSRVDSRHTWMSKNPWQAAARYAATDIGVFTALFGMTYRVQHFAAADHAFRDSTIVGEVSQAMKQMI